MPHLGPRATLACSLALSVLVTVPRQQNEGSVYPLLGALGVWGLPTCELTVGGVAEAVAGGGGTGSEESVTWTLDVLGTRAFGFLVRNMPWSGLCSPRGCRPSRAVSRCPASCCTAPARPRLPSCLRASRLGVLVCASTFAVVNLQWCQQARVT